MSTSACSLNHRPEGDAGCLLLSHLPQQISSKFCKWFLLNITLTCCLFFIFLAIAFFCNNLFCLLPVFILSQQDLPKMQIRSCHFSASNFVMLPAACGSIPKSWIWTSRVFHGLAWPDFQASLIFHHTPLHPPHLRTWWLCAFVLALITPHRSGMPPQKLLDPSVYLLNLSPFQAQLRVIS